MTLGRLGSSSPQMLRISTIICYASLIGCSESFEMFRDQESPTGFTSGLIAYIHAFYVEIV
jgi:hypothetical protein